MQTNQKNKIKSEKKNLLSTGFRKKKTPMSTTEALEILGQLEEVEKYEKQNAEKVEPLKKKAEEAKTILLNHMKLNNLPFVPQGNKFWVLERKLAKAPLTEELVKIVYRTFRNRRGSATTEEELEDFMKTIEEARIKLGTYPEKLKKSKTRPARSLVL